MSKVWVVMVCVGVCSLGVVLGGPAKLDRVAAVAAAASTQGYNYNPPQPTSGYNYEPPQQSVNLYQPPQQPSGLYDTPLPQTTPPPTTRPTPPPTTRPPPPPPPPSGLYNVPRPSNPKPVTAPPPSPAQPPRRTTTTPAPMMGGMPYDFGWGVDDPDSGNQFSQKESSDGNVVRGEYRVLLPDGRLQIVRYFDEGNGFNVDITYE